jgi:hypothetical protein
MRTAARPTGATGDGASDEADAAGRAAPLTEIPIAVSWHSFMIDVVN